MRTTAWIGVGLTLAMAIGVACSHADTGGPSSGGTTSGGTTSGGSSSGASGSSGSSGASSGASGSSGSSGSSSGASGSSGSSGSSSGSSGDGGTAFDASVPDGSYAIDFTTAVIENPLSAGGRWTNNTQGTGGNVAPGNMTSMRVDLASDGVTKIAFDTHGGVDYDDSFAFVPDFPGDQYIEAVIYKEPGYNPNASGSNHELELIVGCSSAAGSRTWNEFLFNSGGGVDVVYLNGGPADFTVIGNVGGSTGTIPKDGDVVRATRIGNVLSLYLNGVKVAGYDGTDPSKVAKGSGIGIAGFIRPGATHNKYGFKRVVMGRL